MQNLTAASVALFGWVLAGVPFAAAGQLHIGLDLRRAIDVPEVVPVQVLEVTRMNAGVTARLVNVALQPVVAVQVVVGEPLANQRQLLFMGVTTASPTNWSPGEVETFVVPAEGLSADAVVRVRAVVMADGSGHGDARVVEAFRRRFSDLHDSAATVLAVTETSPPDNEENLQALIDRLALALARAPSAATADDGAAAFLLAIRTLKELQGRDITGTERMEREFSRLRNRLHEQRDAARRFPVPSRQYTDPPRSVAIPADAVVAIGRSSAHDLAVERRVTDMALRGAAPVEVLDVTATPAGVSATLANRSAQTIAAYVIGLRRSSDADPEHFETITSNWGSRWSPGTEVSILLSSRASDDPARVVVRAVVLADGTGYGDATYVERIRRDWDHRRRGLSGALALMEAPGTAASEEDLQGVIDRIALTMARVPIGSGGESVLHPYVRVIAGLRQLQGRAIAGADRLTREMSQLAETMRQELAAVPGVPTSIVR